MVPRMNMIREVSTGQETSIPFRIVDLEDGSSTVDPMRNYARAQPVKPEPSRSDTSDPKGSNILIYNKSRYVLNSIFVDRHVLVESAPSYKYVVRLLRENVLNHTMIAPTRFNISGAELDYTNEDKADSYHDFVDISEARLEVKELVSAFLDDVRTDETLERCELVISDIIDRYGKRGIAALQAEISEPAIEPLAWKFLNALGVRRGQSIDGVARSILLRHLNSRSAGRRSAAASALGAFPDAVVLAALERRAALENNRIVLATLKAHIRVLKGDAPSTPQNI